MTTRWFLSPEPRDERRARLFCLPYAGGSAAVFRSWMAALGPELEVMAVQLPGRGWRLREAPLSDLRTLARDVAQAIVELDDIPFALFGHSMGSWLGLEVVRRLEEMGRPPLRFFASGRQAPGLGSTHPPLSHLSDSEFVEEVQRRYGGIPKEIVAERELLELLLPALRADIAMLEAYGHRPGRPIGTPIHAIVGVSDLMVSAEEMAPWAEEAAGEFEVSTLEGGHFYFQPDPGPLLELLRSRLPMTETAYQNGSKLT